MLNFPKQNLISMSLNIPQDNDNFSHKMLEKFIVSLIVFINHFRPR